MMKESNPSAQPWVAMAQAEQTILPTEPLKQGAAGSAMKGAQFDEIASKGNTLSDLKKMQDPDKFNKARFRFRLYKK